MFIFVKSIHQHGIQTDHSLISSSNMSRRHCPRREKLEQLRWEARASLILIQSLVTLRKPRRQMLKLLRKARLCACFFGRIRNELRNQQLLGLTNRREELPASLQLRHKWQRREGWGNRPNGLPSSVRERFVRKVKTYSNGVHTSKVGDRCTTAEH